jgi:hypothetical protein
MFSAGFLVTLLDRAKAIVRRVTRPAAIAPALDIAPISPAIRGRARNWMSIKLRALSGLILRIEAGETREAPARPRIVAGRFAAPGKRDEFAPEERLPRGFGWMCGFGPHVRQDGAAFAAWLGEPAMLARVLAAPQQMARVVSPILHATGVPTPEWLATLSTQVKSPPSGASGLGREADGAGSPEASPLGTLAVPPLARPLPHAAGDFVEASSGVCGVADPGSRGFRRVVPDQRRDSLPAPPLTTRWGMRLHANSVRSARIFKNWETDEQPTHAHFVTIS